MANEVAPNPISTSFIPEAWDNARTETQYNKALDANYIKLSPQNVPITFLNSLTIPTPASISDSTLATTTAWVRTFFSSLLSQTLVWDLVQTYDSIIIPTPAPESNTTLPSTTAWVRTYFTSLLSQTLVWNLVQTYVGFLTNAINPSGTLLIGHGATNNNVEIASIPFRTANLNLGNGDNASGGIHIGNGVGSNNNVNIGGGTLLLGSATSTITLNCPLTPGYTLPIANTFEIGYFAPVTFITNDMSSASPSMRSVSLTPGVWFLTATFASYSSAGSNNVSFNSGSIARNGTWQFNAGQPFLPWGLTTSTVVEVTAPTTTYTLNIRNDSGGNLSHLLFHAVRIG
jgi:hypothetical protein